MLLSLLLLVGSASAAPAIPAHTALVVDQAGVLSRSDQIALHRTLADFQKRQGPQIQVLIIPSLEGTPIEDYSIRVVDQWKLGGAKEDNGVLFLVALEDRAMRIEVGQGLEGQIPDALAGRIIDHVVIPHFQQGQLVQGILAGVSAIAEALGGKLAIQTKAPTSRRHVRSRGVGSLFPVVLFLFLFFSQIFGRRGRYRRSGAGNLLTGILLGSVMSGRHRGHWGGGGGFGGGGFGGFGGGGGGGFSGGGASGRW